MATVRSLARKLLLLVPTSIRSRLVLSIWMTVPRRTRVVHVEGQEFRVARFSFWERFEEGWEPETLAVFHRYLSHGGTFVDVGAFVGPTVLYAAAAGATQIEAVEASPVTFRLLESTREYNATALPPTRLHFRCISTADNEEVRMSATGPVSSGASSINSGEAFLEWTVPSILLSTLLRETGFGGFGLLKIDIEGAESDITEDIRKVGEYPQTAVHLSLHPPFWGDKDGAASAILNMTRQFNIFDVQGSPLSRETLQSMMLTDERNPSWGTGMGNFFEVVLESKA